MSPFFMFTLHIVLHPEWTYSVHRQVHSRLSLADFEERALIVGCGNGGGRTYYYIRRYSIAANCRQGVCTLEGECQWVTMMMYFVLTLASPYISTYIPEGESFMGNPWKAVKIPGEGRQGKARQGQAQTFGSGPGILDTSWA